MSSAPLSASPPAPEEQLSAGQLRCPLCRHVFSPGSLPGSVFCPHCGKRFHPNAAMEETVSLPPPGDEEEGERRAGSSRRLAVPLPDDEAEPVDRIGDYDILGEIARGGMGVVYKARQRTLKRIVALKVLRGGDEASPEELARFMREAKAAASLSHPNIVPIHELNVDKGRHFFTMDYIEGTPLDRRLEAGPLAPFEAAEILETVARAVSHAHQHAIIHRDLKPANIILDVHHRPLITDFGLAVNLVADAASQRMTRTGAVMGTIPYIPPEQAAGRVEGIDARSDVYSLGAVFYEMLTGRPPFQGETQYELLRRVIHQEPPPPRQVNPRIHPDAATICLKCLAKDPRRRYQTAEELADDCRAFLRGEVIRARPSTWGYHVWRFLARHRVPAGMAAGLLFLLLGGFWAMRRLETKVEQKERAVEVAERQVRALKVEKEQELRRDWRQEYACSFERGFAFTAQPAAAHQMRAPWLEPRGVRLADREGGVLELTGEVEAVRDGKARPVPVRGLVGLPALAPAEFRFACRARLQPDAAASLLLLANTDRVFQRRDTTLVLALGTPARAGAKLAKGEAVLKEDAAFSLAPGAWHEVDLTRAGGSLTASVDGKIVLQIQEKAAADADPSFFALGAQGVGLEIDDVSVSVLGLSQAMIRSLLEVAAALGQVRDYALAQTLYERVARENATRAVRLAALRGYARCLGLSRPSRPAILDECSRLVDRMRLAQPVPPDEENFLLGLALSELRNAADIHFAHEVLGRAVRASEPSVETMLSTDSFWMLGPFAAEEGADALSRAMPPEQEFVADRDYPGKGGPVRWTRLGTAGEGEAGGLVRLPGESPAIDGSLFYVRRVFRCREPLSVALQTGSSDGLVLWVNGQRLLTRDGPRVASAASESADAQFKEGENAVLLKVRCRQGPAHFSLQVVPTRVPAARLGLYGLLARLESAMLSLKTGDIDGLRTRLTAMDRDGALEALADDRYAEDLLAGGTLGFALDQADAMLKRPGDLETPRALLEAMKVLYPGRGKDLSTRYHRLGGVYRDRKRWDEARAAFVQASALVPTWYVPLFDRAVLSFQRGEPEKGIAAFAEASAQLPESLELQLAISGFWLEEVEGRARNSAFARAAAERALAISQRKSPAAWDAAARAHWMSGSLKEAKEAIEAAIRLEDLPARRQQEAQILDALGRIAPESQPIAPEPQPIAPKAEPAP